MNNLAKGLKWENDTRSSESKNKITNFPIYCFHILAKARWNGFDSIRRMKFLRLLLHVWKFFWKRFTKRRQTFVHIMSTNQNNFFMADVCIQEQILFQLRLRSDSWVDVIRKCLKASTVSDSRQEHENMKTVRRSWSTNHLNDKNNRLSVLGRRFPLLCRG